MAITLEGCMSLTRPEAGALIVGSQLLAYIAKLSDTESRCRRRN